LKILKTRASNKENEIKDKLDNDGATINGIVSDLSIRW